MDDQRVALAAGPKLRIPLGKLALLGVAACLVWLGAAIVDVWVPARGTIPQGLRLGVHVVLVLVPAGVALVWLQPPAALRRHRPVGFYVLETLVLLLAAIPSLAPYTAASDLLSLPLRAPTLSLGVALAAVDPFLMQRWGARHERDASLAVAAGVSFALSCGIIGLALLALLPRLTPDCPSRGCVWLGVEQYAIVFETLACAVTGVLGAWIGYRLGAMVAQSGRWM